MNLVLSSPTDPKPRGTLASVMLVSRALYHEGAKVLLSQDVTLHNAAEVSSFVECCLAEDGIRTRYVRSLVLHVLRLSPTVATTFSELIPKLTNLASVSLLSPDISWSRSNEDDTSERILFDTIASLTTLSRLTLISAASGGDKADRSMQVVKTLRSPLRELALSGMTPTGSPIRLSMLSSCASTLEKLHLIHSSFFGPQGDPSPNFPSLSYLKVSFTVLQPTWLHISDYIHAFPNLRLLTVLNTNIPWQSCSSGDQSQKMEEARKYNEEAFSQAGRLGSFSLEELRSDVLTAWSLGLCYRVQNLRLVVHELGYMRWLPELLSQLRPGTLGLRFEAYGLKTPYLKDILAVALKDAPPDLNSVSIGVHLVSPKWLHVHPGRLDPESLVQSLLVGVPSLRGTALEVLDYTKYSARFDLDTDF